GELEVLDVIPVDARERREALAIVGAVVHQPVLRLAVRIEKPFRRHVGGECGRCHWQQGTRQQCDMDRITALCHGVLPIVFWSKAVPFWVKAYITGAVEKPSFLHGRTSDAPRRRFSLPPPALSDN